MAELYPVEGTPALPVDGLQDRLKGNQDFQNFIGFVSNPLQNIDPRAVTEFWPVFISSSTSAIPAIPKGDIQVYGAGVNVALSDRLSFGLNQGGYAQADFNRDQPGLFPLLNGRLYDRRNYSGLREGWLNIGGFFQYTFIADVENQFLLSGGLRWVSPSGASQLFQGNPPWMLSPYLTAGKELGKWHVLATVGYDFPAGDADPGVDFFYANVHLDRQCFGWFYPLVEVNSTYHTTNASLQLPTRFGFIDMGSFSGSGNLVTLSAGANAVLVKNKVELGAVYTTTLASQRDFNVNGLLVKMVLRY